MKTTILVLALLVNSFISFAEEINLPVVKKPSILEEGTQRTLTDDQIAELLPWAKNSKLFLTDLLDSILSLSMVDKIERLTTGIEQVVSESAPKQSELLMRYILNRALVLNKTLSNEMDDSAIGSIDTKYRVLVSSINMAIKYYDTDMKTLAKTGTPNFQVFGTDYFSFLNELNKSIFDASAQYTIQRIALEWLQWDLYRDINNQSFASQIVKINNALKMTPVGPLKDAQAIKYLQQLKKITLQLKIEVPVVQKAILPTKYQLPKKTDKSLNYRYDIKTEKCYAMSIHNEFLYTKSMDDAYCMREGSYYYSAEEMQCFAVSKENEIMYSTHVRADYCMKAGVFRYSLSKWGCFAVSNNDQVMLNSLVPDKYCIKKEVYRYSSEKEACYAVSKDGDIMYNFVVSDRYCIREGVYKFSPEHQACFATSYDDQIMFNSPVYDKKCN